MERTINGLAQLLVEGFPQVDTANMADAGHELVKVMDAGIKPLHRSMKVAGPVYTIDQPGGSNLSILQAANKAPAGCVLVINAQGWMKSGHIGGLIALACKFRGIAGIVIDGAIRDVPDIIEMGFPVFARGAVSRGNGHLTGEVQQTIQCGGVTVTMQDMIFADATGVVVFSQDQAQSLYDKAVDIANKESGFAQQISEGKGLLEMAEFTALHNIKVD